MITALEEVSQTFARFAATAEPPDEVIERVKKSVLDVLACTVYGSSFPAVQPTLKYTHAHLRGDEATITCAGGRATAFGAAMVNGTYAHTTELAEGFTRALVHPGNVVVPAVLAVGERDHCSGQDLLRGAAVGYEIKIRLGLSFGWHLPMELGLHPPAKLGPLASAIAVARMLQFDEPQMANAIGIAANHTATPLMKAIECNATVKDLFQGWSAALGVFSVDMATAGLTGVDDWVEPWFHAVLRTFDAEPLLKDLGTFWHTSSGGIRIKTRPVMGMAQPTMQCMAQMVDAHDIDHREVERIVVESSARVKLGDMVHPTNLVAARASIPFLAAAAIVRAKEYRGDKYMLWFLTDEVVEDQDAHALADKVELVANPEFDHNLERSEVNTTDGPYMKFEARVTVHLRDGTEISEYADMFALGTGRMSREQVADKFTACVSQRLNSDRANQIVETVWALDELDDVGKLVELVAD